MGIDKVIEGLLTEEGSLVTDERTNSLIVTDVEENFPRIEQAIAQLDVKTAQILIEAELVEINAQKVKDLGLEWGTGTEGTLVSLSPAKSTVAFPFSGFDNKTLGRLSPTKIASGSTSGVTLGTLSTDQFDVVLKAIETDTTSKILARPKILTLDNESATIRLSSQTAIGTITTNPTQVAGTTATESAERTETGVRLVVTPQVNEHGYVTLLIEPAVSRPVQSSFFSSKFVDPKTRSARTLVRVKDGETIVMGGLIDRQKKRALRKVPLLGDIPVLGLLFQKEDVEDDETELIVFITPRIVKDDAHVAQAVQPAVLEPIVEREQERPVAQRDEAIETLLNRMEGRRQ